MKKLTKFLSSLSLFTKIVITVLTIGAGGVFIPKWFTAADDLSLVVSIALLIIGIRFLIALWQPSKDSIQE